MIALGEKNDHLVLVFETAKAQQTLTDDEAMALHAQLGLLIATRQRRKGPSSPAPVSPASSAFMLSPPVDLPSMAPPSKPPPKPWTRRKPMREPSPDAGISSAPVDVLDDADEDPAAAMAEAARRDQEQIEADQRKRRNAARARQGLPPLDGDGEEAAE